MSLNEKDYPYYLSQAYLVKTGQKLNLRHPKTLNEKIQWLKLFDNKQQKSELTDKVLVRDWVREKIGDEYLKPVLWIGDKFDDIPFNSLPFSFIVKCNHGCKWQFRVKNKQEFLSNADIFNSTKMYMDNWLIQSFFGWSDFETQYKDIKPQIIIEPLLKDTMEASPLEIEVWCFNGEPKIIQECKDIQNIHTVKTFDENLNFIDLKFKQTDKIEQGAPNENIQKAMELSKKLSENFKFVRVDWILYNNKLYFGEMNFTPYSGFIIFAENNQKYYEKLGEMLNLK